MASSSPNQVAVTVHYRRCRRDYDGWELWAFVDSNNHSSVALDGKVDGETICPLPSVAAVNTPRRDAFGVVFRFGIQVGPQPASSATEQPPGRPDGLSPVILDGADMTGRSICLLPRWGDWFAEDKPNRRVNVDDLLQHTVDLARSGPLARQMSRIDKKEVHLYIVEGESGVSFSTSDFFIEPGVPRFVAVSLESKSPASTVTIDGEPVAPVAKKNFFLAAYGENNARKDCFAGNTPAASNEFLLDRMDFAGHTIGLVPVDKAAHENVPPTDPSAAIWWVPEMGHSVSLNQQNCSLAPIGRPGEPSKLKKKLSLSTIVGGDRMAGRRRLIVRYQRYDPEYDGWKLHMWPSGNHESRVEVPRYSVVYNGSAVFAMDLSLFDEPESSGIQMCLSDPGGIPQSAFSWVPDLSYDVFLLEGETVLTPRTSTETFVTYRRLGPIEDWENWELWMWASETAESQSKVVRVQTSVQKDSCSVLFDTSCAHFPKGWTVFVQPVKVAKGRDGDPEPVSRDQIRAWHSHKRGEHVFIFQGVESVMESGRLSDDAKAELQQHVPIKYRRHVSLGRDDWYLEVTDNIDDGLSTVYHLETSKIYLDSVEFSIDRSTLACGIDLSIVPVRMNQNEVLEKDGKPRSWNQTRNRESQLLLQGHPCLVVSVTDAIGCMSASVCPGQRVALDTSFPIFWYHEDLKKMPLEIERVSSKGERKSKLRWTFVEKISPTRLILSVDPSLATFEEDFEVENFEVLLGGYKNCMLRWEKFEELDRYYYDGELGCLYEQEKCIFRCFAPTAQTVSLVLYREPEGNEGRHCIPMRRIPQGCWKVVVKEDLKGKYYKLLAEGDDKRLFPGVEVIDPYSRCNTSHVGRSLIFGHDRTPIADRPKTPASEAIIYELHLRDATIDPQSGVTERGKFLGLTEQGTVMGQGEATVTTGLDHILEMGVTAVQILPMQDFDNHEEVDGEYRWGYMPVHFNSPDGWYASDVRTVARVREMKQLVDALHKVGLKVIMDVVYNHTAEDSNEFNLEARFSFNGLAPRYYYRNCGNLPMSANGFNTCAFRGMEESRCGGCYSNGSGCGNEFRSESPMGRKFLLDSLEYWVNEFKVDGFRFDLVGLIDTETMTIASRRLHDIDPNIMIYGEPWTAGPTPIEPTVKGSQRDRGFGVFNDDFRNALRGTPFGVEENFLMDGGHAGRVKRGIMGSIDEFASCPLESINYIECHDNRTLYDSFVEYRDQRNDSIEYTEIDLRRMQMLGGAIVLTSQGIPFIQMGQEMCRTKGGVENSYESPDSVNMIQWSWKESRKEVVAYYRGLVHLRKSHFELFNMGSAEEIRGRLIFYEELGLPVADRCVGYRILGRNWASLTEPSEDEWSAVVVLLNPTPVGVDFELPGSDEDAMWNVVVDDKDAGVETLEGPLIGEVHVNGRSAMVLRRCSLSERRLASLEIRLGVVSDAFVVPVEEAVAERSVGL